MKQTESKKRREGGRTILSSANRAPKQGNAREQRGVGEREALGYFWRGIEVISHAYLNVPIFI